MNEPHDPDDWQEGGDLSLLGRAIAFVVVYAMYVGIIFTIMR